MIRLHIKEKWISEYLLIHVEVNNDFVALLHSCSLEMITAEYANDLKPSDAQQKWL